MKIRNTMSFVALVISCIITLVINYKYSKVESSASLSFSSTNDHSIVKFAFAMAKNGSDSIFNNITSAKLVDDFNKKGTTLINTGNCREAIVLIDKVLTIDRNNTLAMTNKALALGGLGKHQEAITWFDKVLAINETDTHAMNNKGVGLDNLGKYQEAIGWFDKALNQTQPTGIDIDAVSNKAFVLGINLKEYNKVLSLTEEYLKKSPEHKGLLCVTVEIYNETGYQGIANHYKEQLSKLDPNYKCGLIVKSEVEKEAFA